MTELEQQIKRIQEKLQLLLKQHQALQKEKDSLKKELEKLQSSHHTQTLLVDQLQQQAEILKLSKTEMNLDEKKAFEKRLNYYVKEIDRCIALLNE